jgi:hypothetical protein
MPFALAALAMTSATLAAACSGAPPMPAAPEPVPSAPPAPTTAPVPMPSAAEDAGAPSEDGGAAEADAGVPDGAVAAAPASGPAACPDGMALVDGDYCTELEVTCKKSHYAEQNKKTICAEFVEPTRCIGKKIHRRYCIDKYEYPNKKGENPEVMNDFPHAQRLCAAQGKRVCTESEWTMACEGPSYKPYPYGYVRDPNKCRGDRPYKFPSKSKNGVLVTHGKDKKKAEAELARLWDAVPSGSQPECVSDYGVYDMPGNADELAASDGQEGLYGTMKMPDGHVETLRSKNLYDNVTTGGPWLEGVRNQCRPKIYTHNEGFSYYYLSFRCCAEADGKPTDPRAPRQIARGQKWK